MAKENRHIKSFSFLFLLIFATYLGSTTLFNHTHIIDGVAIVHSHLNTGEHSHSQQNIETIFMLSNIHAFGDFSALSAPILWMFLTMVIVVPALLHIAGVMHGTLFLRAPPVLF